MKVLVLILAIFTAVAVGSTAGSALSYREALRLATEYDAGVAAMRQRVSRASTDIQAQKDAWFPSLSLAAETNSTATGGPKAVATLSQVLFDWGLIRSKVAAASYERVKSVAELKSAVETLAYDIAEQFVSISTLDRKIAETEEYADFARRIAGFSQDRVAAGIADAAEIARARLEISRAEDQLFQLRGDRQVAAEQLRFLVGRAADRVEPLPDLGFARRFGSSGAVISAVLIAPEYVIAKAKLMIAEKNVDKARAASRPTISIQAQGKQALNGERGRSGSIGLAASMDLGAGDFRGRAVKGARQDLEAARQDLTATERDLQNTVRASVQQIRILDGAEAAQRAQLVEADKVLEVYEQQFVAGRREMVELLSTGRDRYDAKIAAVDLAGERKQTEYKAAKAIGALGSLIVTADGRP